MRYLSRVKFWGINGITELSSTCHFASANVQGDTASECGQVRRKDSAGDVRSGEITVSRASKLHLLPSVRSNTIDKAPSQPRLVLATCHHTAWTTHGKRLAGLPTRITQYMLPFLPMVGQHSLYASAGLRTNCPNRISPREYRVREVGSGVTK